MADVNAMYDAIESMRPTPLRKAPVAVLVLAAVIPLLAMAAIEVPVAEIAKKLLAALIWPDREWRSLRRNVLYARR